MNRKFALGILSILAVMISVVFSNTASAAKIGKNDSAAQVVSTTLVISQAYGGGGGTTGTYMFDYVELKNISGTPQSTAGLSLMYGSATGQFGSSATNIFALPTTTINPGQYYLVQLSTAGTGGTAFPVTPDATTTGLSMSGTSGKIALVTSSFAGNTCGATATPCNAAQLAAIVDWVAYGAAGNGTAGNGEGGTSVNNGAALTSTQGSVRKNGGCTDTDNNNADFDILSPPIPRNTSSTATSCSAPAVTLQHVVDFNGDGRTDFSVVRNIGAGGSGATNQLRWFITLNNGSGTTYGSDWGLATDRITPADFDGDSKTDIAVWRSGAATVAAFYILQSATNTVRIERFGQAGDDATMVGDYDGDGKADVAVYRAGAQSTWFYRGTLNNPSGNVTYVNWGQTGDKPVPGDFDGDGKYDFTIARAGAPAQFWTLLATGAVQPIKFFGDATQPIAAGDYDGDGKTDIMTTGVAGGSRTWFLLPSSTGIVSAAPFATFGIPTDTIVQGDYDGDGKTDIAIWRSGTFWVSGSTAGVFTFQFGVGGDSPVANYNVH